jgi:hypothetical protein
MIINFTKKETQKLLNPIPKIINHRIKITLIMHNYWMPFTVLKIKNLKNKTK